MDTYTQHLTAEPGRKNLDPRAYQHRKSVQLGKTRAAAPAPEAAQGHTPPYAANTPKATLYSVPRNVAHLCLIRNSHGASLDRAAELIPGISGDQVIIFRCQDRPRLVSREFSVCAFEAQSSRKLPSGEYISRLPPDSAAKKHHTNAESFLLEHGFRVIYVDDLFKTAQLLATHRIRFDGERLSTLIMHSIAYYAVNICRDTVLLCKRVHLLAARGIRSEGENPPANAAARVILILRSAARYSINECRATVALGKTLFRMTLR
jgi:hypothetical protein